MYLLLISNNIPHMSCHKTLMYSDTSSLVRRLLRSCRTFLVNLGRTKSGLMSDNGWSTKRRRDSPGWGMVRLGSASTMLSQ